MSHLFSLSQRDNCNLSYRESYRSQLVLDLWPITSLDTWCLVKWLFVTPLIRTVTVIKVPGPLCNEAPLQCGWCDAATSMVAEWLRSSKKVLYFASSVSDEASSSPISINSGSWTETCREFTWRWGRFTLNKWWMAQMEADGMGAWILWESLFRVICFALNTKPYILCVSSQNLYLLKAHSQCHISPIQNRAWSKFIINNTVSI